MKKGRFRGSAAENIIGYSITRQSLQECTSQIMGWIDKGEKGRWFACANPHSLVIAKKDLVFRQAILSADLVTPDGIAVIWASNILGGSLTARVTGYDIFTGLNQMLDGKGGYRVFFLGSTPAHLKKISRKMADVYPNVTVAGTCSPPFKTDFGSEESHEMVEAVNACKPHVLWVGMGAPKQEKWIYRNLGRLDVNFIGAVGAVFDFFIGKVQRSTPIILKSELEWVPRFFQEPRRLWKRILISTPAFFFLVALQRLKIHKAF